MAEKIEAQTGEPLAFYEEAGRKGSRIPLHLCQATRVMLSTLTQVSCPCQRYKDQVECCHYSICRNFVAWGFLPIGVRGLAVSCRGRGVLDPPFLIDLPVRGIITSRLPCRNTVGIASQISLMHKLPLSVKLLKRHCVCGWMLVIPMSFS